MIYGKGGKPKARTASMRDHSLTKTECAAACHSYSTTYKASTMEAVVPRKRKTISEALSEGEVPIHHKQWRTFYLICYQTLFNELDESDWPSIIKQITSEVGGSPRVIRRVFEGARRGDLSILKQKPGAGWPHKLSADNKGLLSAAMALNVGVAPSLATEICNSVNEKERGNTELNIHRDTLLNTLRGYTDVKKNSILRHKTGSKDPTGAWAWARL